MKLTPEELLKKKQRDNLQRLCNSIKSAFSFGKIKKWEDVNGYIPTDKTGEISFIEIKGFTDKMLADFDNPPAFIIPPTDLEQPTIPPDTADESGFNNTNDYGLHSSPKEKAFLFWFQKKAVKELWDGIQAGHRGQLLLAGTGTGKTFMAAALVRRLVDSNYHEGKTFGTVNYLYVTRATIVEQTKRVFQNLFDLGIKDGVEILNIEQLRSRAGAAWVNDEQVIVNGEEQTIWKWRKMLNPVVILWDECQALKNEGSTQHNIASALNDLDVTQVFISATPFTRVCEAKCFAVSTRKDIRQQLGIPGKLTLNTWPTYASAIAQGDPAEHNEAAVERLVKDLDKYIVRVKGVRPQFDAINTIKMISFQTSEERMYYESAYERYLKEKAKLEALDEGGGGGGGGMAILVQFLKFRMAAEYCRRRYLAEQMYKAVTENNQAAVAAINFKGTIIGIVKILVDEFKVPREQISLVWGGGQTQLTKKQKAKKSIKDKVEQLKQVGLEVDDLLEDLDLDEVEDRELEDLPEHLKLGSQSKEERQREIDKFQSGRSLYCLYTFRAGGVGLSLHHTDELSKVKVRKHKNGYAVVDDIHNVPVRQRINFVAPTYSAIELVQGLGRTPRLTSLSDSPQVMVFYRNTIEDSVARIVSQKLRCLSKVVRTREKWADVVVGGVPAEKHLVDDATLETTSTDYDALNEDEEEEE